MDVLRFHDPAAYAAVAEPFLLRNEAANCFHLGQISQLASPTDALLLVARDADGPLAVASMTPGRHMVITEAPDAAVQAFVDHMHEHHLDTPGIQGPRPAAESFARRWRELTGKSAVPRVNLAVHEMTEVVPPPPAPGAMRFATPTDLAFLPDWVDDLRRALGEGHLGGTRQVAEERVAARQLCLWEDAGRPVSMAGFLGPTPHGIRVVLVYTPPALRGRGYASNLVAALSQHLLDTGRRFCFLYTDLANPTSNKIYRAIGYRPVCESLQLMFDPPAAGR